MAMKPATGSGTYHARPHTAVHIYCVVPQRQDMASITNEGGFEARSSFRVAAYPVQRRGRPITCGPEHQNQDIALVTPEGRRLPRGPGQPNRPSSLPEPVAN